MFKRVFLSIGTKTLQRSFSDRPEVFKMVSKAPTLYVDETSPPVRFVLMTAKYLNLQLNIENVDLFKKENLSEEYKKINPLQKVPAMVTGEHTILDSNAISMYLCQKYNIIGQELYPTSLLERSKVDHLIFFNATVLFPIDRDVYSDFFRRGDKDYSINKEDLQLWRDAIDYLETLLEHNSWLCGDHITLADLCCAATISSFLELVPMGLAGSPYVVRWLFKMKERPFYKANQQGIKRLKTYIDLIKQENN